MFVAIGVHDARISNSVWEPRSANSPKAELNANVTVPLKPVVGDSVKVHGVKVIVFGDEAKSPDNSGHNPTSETIPEEKSDNVFAYGG